MKTINAGVTDMSKPKKKIMRRFRVDEVSSVDVPAQEHARMTLFKRHVPDDADAKELAAFEDWLAKGAFNIGDPEASTITLLLDGEERTFFTKRDDDEPDDDDDDEPDEDEPVRKAKPKDIDPTTLAAVLAALGKQTNEIEAGIAELKKEGEIMTTKTVTKRPEDFMKKVAEIMKRDGCKGTDAMSKARVEDPEAFAIYKHRPNFPDVSALAKRAAQVKTVEKGRGFMTLAAAIAKRDNCDGTVAMQKARVEHADAYAAWNNS